MRSIVAAGSEGAALLSAGGRLIVGGEAAGWMGRASPRGDLRRGRVCFVENEDTRAPKRPGAQ